MASRANFLPAEQEEPQAERRRFEDQAEQKAGKEEAAKERTPRAKRPREEPRRNFQDRAEQEAVAAHYNNIRPAVRRKYSPIIGVRKLNNFLKAVLINEFLVKSHPDPTGAVVLDLCSGKGGDLTKFQRLKNGAVKSYVGADHALESVKEAIGRYNRMLRPPRRRDGNSTRTSLFAARFISADCHLVRLSRAYPPSLQFDLVSCQFAFHYCFSTEQRVRGMLQNITERLKVGGYFVATLPSERTIVQRLCGVKGQRLAFGNEWYSIDFERMKAQGSFISSKKPFGIRYVFNLTGAVENCPEYLVQMKCLTSLADEYGLKIAMGAKDFDVFLKEFARNHLELRDKMGVQALTREQWEIARLYCAVAFVKTRETPQNKLTLQMGAPAAEPAASQSLTCCRLSNSDVFELGQVAT